MRSRWLVWRSLTGKCPAMAIQRRRSCCENVKPILTLHIGHIWSSGRFRRDFRSTDSRTGIRHVWLVVSTHIPTSRKSTPSILNENLIYYPHKKPYYTQIKKKFIMAYGVFTLDVIVTLALSGGLLYNYGDWFRHRVLVTLAGMATKS